MRRYAWRLLDCAGLALAVLAGCTAVEKLTKGPDRFIDLRFTVAGAGDRHLARAVDGAGALWYLDRDRIVRTWAPSLQSVVRDGDARSGNLFWYEGAIYMVGSDGRTLTRFDSGSHADPVEIPAQYAPVEGVVADALHRWVVFARSTPHKLAVLDVWKWYDEDVPKGIDPFSVALAGGPHGKKYLVTGDVRAAAISIENRWTRRAMVEPVADNACAPDWRVPVDVRGRGEDRVWVTTGRHVVSIDLASKRPLRVWDLDVCALRIVMADRNEATIVAASREDSGYSSRFLRIDKQGVHELPEYGRIAGLVADVVADRYGRLWWYDRASGAFVCRTPLGQAE